jgi:hypothetical protein
MNGQEIEYSNLLTLPSSGGKRDHSNELIIEEFDQWRIPEAVGGVLWNLRSFQDDRAEAA